MKVLALFLVAIFSFVLVPQVHATTLEELEAKMDAMQKAHEAQINALKAEIQALKTSQAKTNVTVAKVEQVQEQTSKVAFVEVDRAPISHERGTYRSPVLAGVQHAPRTLRFGKNIHLGGYIDMEYFDEENGNRKFDQHRLIPFITADVTDRIKFATEIEFEHGATNNNAGDGATKIEFAAIDYLIKEYVNLRAGILLSPLGKFNLVHDSPINDLTDRPLVARNIIPTTLSESGAGAFGSFYPVGDVEVDYEFYLVNGFDGGGNTGAAIGAEINANAGVRGARGSQKSDNNNNLAIVSRIGVSPFLGSEIGASVHHGAYDDAGNLDLSIYALDWLFQKGPFEFLGEYAYATIERNDSIIAHNATTASSLTADNRIPDYLQGYYVQANYHFLPEIFKKWFPNHVTDDSTFTFVTRWEQIDLNGDEVTNVGERDRLTFGLNFRPVESSVIKFDYQINNGDEAADDNNKFALSLATYF